MKKLLLFVTAIFFSASIYAQYPNLTSDISWSGGTSTIDEVEASFNNARTEENTQLSTNLPMIDFPTQSVWNAKSDPEKAFWIFNTERRDRGIFELEGVDSRISDISLAYTQFLFDNDTSGHVADGIGIRGRLETDSAINACNTHMWENIGRLTSNSVIPTHPLEQICFYLTYYDTQSAWGHRENVLDENFIDDSGETGKEGLLGVGMLYGTNYSGGITDPRAYAYVCTFNLIDPCSSWGFQAVGVEEELIKNNSVYPNPAEGIISFDKQVNTLQIIDITGKVVEVHNQITLLDISHLISGVYFFNIDNQNHKVIIQ